MKIKRLNISGKKFAALLISTCLLVVSLGLVANELLHIRSHKTAFKTYVQSGDYSGFIKANQVFLDDGNGVLARMHSCSATVDDLWHPPTFTSPNIHNDFIDMKYIKYQGELVIAREYARKLTAPTYHGGPLKYILPQAKKEQTKDDDAKKLLEMSKKFAYAQQNTRSDYCAYVLYNVLVPMSYIEKYTDTTTLQTAPISDLDFYISYIDKALANQQATVKVDSPEMAQYDSLFKAWLVLVKTDLKITRSKRLAGQSVADMAANFTHDKQSLNQNLAIAANEGKKITPSTEDLRNLLNAVTTYQK